MVESVSIPDRDSGEFRATAYGLAGGSGDVSIPDRDSGEFRAWILTYKISFIPFQSLIGIQGNSELSLIVQV